MSKKTIVIDRNESEAPRSPSKEAFAALIEAYKKQNPAKYELKKAALEAELAGIK